MNISYPRGICERKTHSGQCHSSPGSSAFQSLTERTSQDFINLIKACMEKIWIAPMINGRPANFFLATRGLRQGCPLSPFLYILMADSLSRKLTSEKHKGCLPGIKIVKGIDPVNHALFVDDSLLLGGASPRIAKSFRTILHKYCSISGALVSERKSVVYGWNTQQHKIETIANDLGYTRHANWEKIKYLGLPITLGSNKNHLWEEVIMKFKRKITAWGGFWLTSRGKIMLIKSVLPALPTFQVSLILAPKLISDQISRLMHNFLWNSGRENTNRFHLISWDMVKRPLAEGELQIRDHVHTNLSLGCKLLWQIHAAPSHPVIQIFKFKYLKNHSIKTYNMEKSPKGTQVWKLCNRGIEFFRSHLYRIPGNGKNTKLWSDSVMGHRPLAENQEITEVRVWLQSKGIKKIEDISSWDRKGNWQRWTFPRIPDPLNAQLDVLQASISDFAPVHTEEEDVWGWGKTGVYTASQRYYQMQSKEDSPHPKSMWKQIWYSFGIPKINFFFWTLFHNKILIRDNLCKRNIAGPHRCGFCKRASETANHLFIACEFSKAVWSFFLTGLNVCPPTQSTIDTKFSSCNDRYPFSIVSNSIWQKVWIAAPKYVCWNLWLAQNEIIFNNKELPAAKVAE
eukprot:PITA_03797